MTPTTPDEGPIAIARADADELLDLRASVLRPGLPREAGRFVGDDESTTRHWVARIGGEVVGCVSLMQAPEPGSGPAALQLRGMAVAPGCRGRGIGRRLLERVHGEVAAPMWCNARVAAESLYSRAGWVRTSDVFAIDGVGPHYAMRYVPGASDGSVETSEESPTGDSLASA